uniref:Uncharacterized protein n=1 Tax=Cyprinus carpio carpio TaxID=630221 RepID=A0A8C1F1Y4_CYPCA
MDLETRMDKECNCVNNRQSQSSFGSPLPALLGTTTPPEEHCSETLLHSSTHFHRHLLIVDSVWDLIKAVSMATCCVAITICGLRHLDLNASVAALQVEYPIGNGDDTALNGIRLHCVHKPNGLSASYYNFASVSSDVGSWGRWTDIKWCPSGFLTAFKLKVEVPQGNGDDTAANNILFRCSQGSLLTGDGTRWGTWGGWSQTCQGKGICGIKTRVERPQGSGDDTALNDASMFCCD